MSFARLAVHLVLAAAFLGIALSSRAAQFGDVSALAQIPAPGFPEGIAIKGDRVYVAGPAMPGTSIDNRASRVWAYGAANG